MTTPAIDEARVAEKAYELWLAEGQPEGRSEEYWFRALDALSVPVAKEPRRAPAKPKAAATAPKAPATRKTKANA